MSDSFALIQNAHQDRWPGELGSRLVAWELGQRFRVTRSDDPKVARLLEAADRWEPVEFFYFGGSEPGERRRLTPTLVFVVASYPRVYVAGLCHRRRALRNFETDRMLLIE